MQCFNLSATAQIAGSQILHRLVFFLAEKPKVKEKKGEHIHYKPLYDFHPDFFRWRTWDMAGS